MSLKISWLGRAVCAAVVCVSLVAGASGNVFNMGPGLTSLETVPVANPGNAGELSGSGAGGYGPDRVCGAVAYTYNIGKYEVTAGQYTEFLNAVAATDTYGVYHANMSSLYCCKIQRSGSSGSYTYSVAADWANRPVNYVSWGDAARFANWLHNGQPTTRVQDATTTEDGAYYLNGATSNADLHAVNRESDWTWAITSEDEWYKAAYHKNDGVMGNYFDYPTSSDSPPSNDLVDPDPGNNGTFNESDDGGYTIGGPYYRTEAGAHENSDSPYGTFDQGGNVWEWNEAIFDGLSRGMRGGSSSSYGFPGGDLHASSRLDYRPHDEDCGVGFRVSAVPEPATMALLAFGCVTLLRRRRSVRG